MTVRGEAAVDARLGLAPRLAWILAVAVCAAVLPWPSARAGAAAAAAAVALAFSARSAGGRVVVAAAAGAILHEGVGRGAIIAGLAAAAAAVLLIGALRRPAGLVDKAAAAAALAGVVGCALLPGLEPGARLAGAAAWVACVAGFAGGARLAAAVGRSRAVALPFAAVGAASALATGLCRVESAAAGQGRALAAAACARRVGDRAAEARHRLVAGTDGAVPPARQIDELVSAFRLGAGDAAWIERVARLRRLGHPEAGAETYRLLLLERPDVAPPVDSGDGFAAHLLLQTGRTRSALELYRRGAGIDRGAAARQRLARALLHGGRPAEALEVLAQLPEADVDVACLHVDAGDPWPHHAARCAAARPFHAGSVRVLGDAERLAALPQTDPVDEEFGGAIALVGRRVTAADRRISVATRFRGLLPSLVPGAAVVSVRGPAPATVSPPSIALAPEPGDLTYAAFEIRTSAPGTYAVALQVVSPWGPWMRTREGRLASDLPFDLGSAEVRP